MNENTYSATSDIWHNQLLDSPLCHKCLELHDHPACTTKPLSADTVSLPPRSIKSGITGALSLHDYRKFLSKSADRVGDHADHASRKLKRKTAGLHLNRQPALSISYPVSISSAASSPPPLSPSYSHSIISQRSEEPEIGEAQPVHYQYHQNPQATAADIGPRGRLNRKRLNTFRERLQKKSEAKAETESTATSKPPDTDSMLASTQAVATVSHGGACFEILNPRKSLDLARIVSYIEDVDSCSVVSVDHHDSTFSLEQGLDRVSLSQLTDASLPSFYSTTNSLYTSLPADPPTPKGQSTDLPSSSPRIRERIRSLSDYSLNDRTFNYWNRSTRNEPTINEPNHHHHSYSERDAPHAHLTSIREEPRPQTLDLTIIDSCPSTPSTRTFYSDSEIGEPGSPVYANGDWAQVDDRDRGIFYEQPEDQDEDLTPSAQEYTSYPLNHNHDQSQRQHQNQDQNQNQNRHHQIHRPQTPESNPEPPTPRETPLDTPLTSPMHSPMYSSFDSAYPYPYPYPSTPSTSKLPHYPPLDPYTYDPVYFDPHVQSVLAAANAENMGLRGTPARALEDFQRGRGDNARFEFSRVRSDERKSVQKKGLKKFFSWRSGN